MTIELFNRGARRANPFFKFPGGELHLTDGPDASRWTGKNIAVVKGTDVEDYIKLALWARTVKEHDGEAHAVIPYFPAARSDRGTPTGADVYADLIKLSPLDSVRVIDPHSYHIVDGINWGKTEFRYTFPYNYPLQWALGVYDYVIAPDKGAVERASYFAKNIGAELVIADKVRDFETGKLLKFTCPELEQDFAKVLMVDDICDGGGTFNGLADVIHMQNRNLSIDLFVTHGIFSQGFDELLMRFDNITFTDSLNFSPEMLSEIFQGPYKHRLSIFNVVDRMIQSI